MTGLDTAGGIYLPSTMAASSDLAFIVHSSTSCSSGVKIKEQLQATLQVMDCKWSQCDGDPLLGEKRKRAEETRRGNEEKSQGNGSGSNR